MAKTPTDAPIEVNVRGHITVPLDGAYYTLRPSFEAIAAIEEKLGPGRPLMVLAGEAVRGVLSLDELGIIIAELMRAEGVANPDAGPSYKDPNPKKLARMIYETSTPIAITARIAVVLTGALTGGYTASGELKPTT